MKRLVTIALAAIVMTASFVEPFAEAFVPPLGAPQGRAAGGHGVSVLLEGRGWGHGRGMGQWGARGMAARGATWSRILGHYYRGIRIHTARRDPQIRVLLTTRRTVFVSSRAPFWISADGGRAKARAYRFYRFRRIGGRTLVEGARRLEGPWGRTLRTRGSIRLRGGLLAIGGRGRVHAYRGTLLLRPTATSLRVIDLLSVEEYLRGVVPREMPAGWPMEALKAQATAARTYAYRVRVHSRARNAVYDICDDARCQVYGGTALRVSGVWRSLEPARTNRAIRATTRRVLHYEGKPILAEYSSSTGGRTIDGDARYLRSVPDPNDRISPFHVWAREITARDVEQRWPSIGAFRGLRVTGRDGRGTWGGRARTVVVRGDRGSIAMRAPAFQAAMELRSRWFRVVARPSAYRFRTQLSYGERSLAVSYLQMRLRAEGFYPGDAPVTSYFGSITRGAVGRYQRAHGIAPSGSLGRATRAALNRSARTSRYRFTFDFGVGTRGAAVRALQSRLRAAGYFPRSVDVTGYFGDITRASVRRYQEARGIPTTGFVGPRTRRALNR